MQVRDRKVHQIFIYLLVSKGNHYCVRLKIPKVVCGFEYGDSRFDFVESLLAFLPVCLPCDRAHGGKCQACLTVHNISHLIPWSVHSPLTQVSGFKSPHRAVTKQPNTRTSWETVYSKSPKFKQNLSPEVTQMSRS